MKPFGHMLLSALAMAACIGCAGCGEVSEERFLDLVRASYTNDTIKPGLPDDELARGYDHFVKSGNHEVFGTLLKERGFRFRQIIGICGLREIGDAKAYDIIAAADVEDSWVLGNVAYSLGKTKEKRFVPILVDLLDDHGYSSVWVTSPWSNPRHQSSSQCSGYAARALKEITGVWGEDTWRQMAAAQTRPTTRPLPASRDQ